MDFARSQAGKLFIPRNEILFIFLIFPLDNISIQKSNKTIHSFAQDQLTPYRPES